MGITSWLFSKISCLIFLSLLEGRKRHLHFYNLEVVKYLVNYVENKHPKSGDYWGQKAPLDWAKEKGHSDIVAFFKEVHHLKKLSIQHLLHLLQGQGTSKVTT